jgi:hypothetical protein
MDEKITIDKSVLDNIINYIGSKPYIEVAMLLNSLSDSIRANRTPDTTQPEEKK